MMPEATKQTGQNKVGRGRRIALYPGAFRPPHSAHLTAVLDLVSRSEVDEVIVIISNRCRIVPGTTKALDANVARRIWDIYLQGFKKIRIEVAAHTAIQHALDYFDHVDTDDTLLFCIGASDLSRGDDRFTKLSNHARYTGVSAELIAAPTSAMTVRSTALRTLLASGAAGRATFMAALPAQLNEQQRAKVWSISYDGMRELSEIIQEKVRAVIDQRDLGEISDLKTVQSGTIDPIFRVLFKDGRCHFIKYAGDTVESGCFGQELTQKPRRRLATERRALKRLRDHRLDAEVDLPEVVLFDKKMLTLVLTEVCPGGRFLLDDLKKGRFDPTVAGTASRFLARCHALPAPIKPVWGDKETDLLHWKRMLNLRTVGIKLEAFPEQVGQKLESLKYLSDEASKNRIRPQLLILDYSPKNILLGKNKVGVIDFELCSTIGDPAYDFGLFLGHYILWGLLTSSASSCRMVLEAGLHVYRKELGNEWLSLRARVVAFAGAAIIDSITRRGNVGIQGNTRALAKTATALLSWGLHQDGEIDEVMISAADGRLSC